MEHHVYTLREIAEAVGLAPLRQVARQPGVKAAYRITVRYRDDRARHSVATLRYSVVEAPALEVVYQGRFGHKPLVHPIDAGRYHALALGLHKLGFDKLRDQPDVPFYGCDLWLVERAAGDFLKSVMIAPLKASGAYAAIANLIDHYLPEALREVQ